MLRSLTFNFRVFAKYVKSKDNDQADSLSRLQFEHFRKLAPKETAFLRCYQNNYGLPQKFGMCTRLSNTAFNSFTGLQHHRSKGKLNCKTEIRHSDGLSSISSSAIGDIIDKLCWECNRDTTKRNYLCVWRNFSKFFFKLDVKPKNWEDRILLYTGFLINEGKKSQMVKSYISAIKAVLREDRFEISENRCLIKSLTRACRFRNDQVTLRLPIQKPVFQLVLTGVNFRYLSNTQPQLYLAALFKAIFTSAYYGLLRISEIAKGEHPVLAKDVHVAINKNKMIFVLRTSKMHWLDIKPQIVKITGENLSSYKSNNDRVSTKCPFNILRNYVKVRASYADDNEPFFVYQDRKPLRPEAINKVLKSILREGKIDPANFSMHGFRSGRSIDLLNLGVSVETIKKLGRWKSTAIFNYLRL